MQRRRSCFEPLQCVALEIVIGKFDHRRDRARDRIGILADFVRTG
jgi:hypothetical protein